MDKIIEYDNLVVLESLDNIDSNIDGIIIVSSQYDMELENLNLSMRYVS